ncbi:MAG TPA: hypothetical protein VLN45_01120, partial [Ignavibacteriaceae bacterium]|nr:hypothetical protein [Ignavibacteriaceae bacterium]
ISFSQFQQYPKPGEGQFMGGAGITFIDDQPHYTIFLAPELSFANFGVGLDLRLTFDAEGNLRKETFNDFSDYLSIIRYVRYGLKNDPVFIKLGALDYYTLGHGSVMYLYNNSPSFDNRKAGLILDIDFGDFGFESIYSRFGEAGVTGIRGYVRPLHFTSLSAIPVIGNLEVGVTFAGDFDENAGIISGSFNDTTDKFVAGVDEGSTSIIGFDIGLPVLSGSFADVTLYYDFNKIINFGSGSATGIIVQLNPLGLIQATAKLERRFNGDEYIPSYFNSFYEIERFKVLNKETGEFQSKARLLSGLKNNDDGWYGELGINALGLLYIIGSYQRLDKTPNSGILHLGTEVAPEEAPFVLRAGYDKINIRSEKDLFTLDDRSYLFTELGYKPYPFMVVSLVYHWTFTPTRDGDDNIVGYEPQKRIEPRVYFIMPFGL